MLNFLPILLVNGNKIVKACDRHTVETVTTSSYCRLRTKFSANFKVVAIKLTELI